METSKPQNGNTLTTTEKKHIKNAERIATKLHKLYNEAQSLMIQAGSNPFLVKKGIKIDCSAQTGTDQKKRVYMMFDCTISLPEELVK